MQLFGINASHFVSEEEHRWARARGTAWFWEVVDPQASGSSPNRKISAAFSLSSLLSRFAIDGQEERQQSAIVLYEELFSNFALCYQDFWETGYESASDYLDRKENRDSFFGDQDDIQKAKDINQIWTMVERHKKDKRTYAASSLRGVLLRAWDQDPRLMNARRMEDELPVARIITPSSRKIRL